jgi:predicted permease
MEGGRWKVEGGFYMNEVRYAVRGLLRRPLFSLTAVLILALGIAGNLCIFSVVKKLILQPLPFRDPDHLIDLRVASPQRGVPDMGLSPPEYLDYRQAATGVLTDLALYGGETDTINLTGLSEPERLATRRVTSNLFSVLGVAPALGRTFGQAEEGPGRGGVVILSDGIWKRLFGGDPGLIGRQITLDEAPYTVVGVMPPGFSFPAADVQAWLPLGVDAATAPRLLRQFVAVGRLNPAVTLVQARTQMTLIAHRLAGEHPDTNTDIEAFARPLYYAIYGDTFGRSWNVALAAVFSLLVIACANVSGLLLTRAAARRRDLAIRSLLGANRASLLWHFLTEGLVLATIASCLGIAISYWGLDLVKHLLPAEFSGTANLRIDRWVLGFAILLGLLTALVCGAIPAWVTLRQNLLSLVKEGGRGSAGNAGHFLRTALVVAEIALAFVMLVATGQLVQSLRNLQHVEMGFDSHNLLALRLTASKNRYPDPAQFINYIGNVLQQVRSIPGVRSAAVINELPTSRYVDWAAVFTIEGQPAPPPGQEYVIQHRVVSPGYFKTMGIPLLKGRDFNDDDRIDLPWVVVINNTMAKEHFAGQDPIGKVLKVLQYRLRIVGVVGDVHLTGPKQPVRPAMYFTYMQNPKYTTSIVMRYSGDLVSLIAPIRATISKVDNHQPLYSIMSLDQALAEDIAQDRTLAATLSLLVALAIMLATSGVYVVIAYTVAQRTQEVGIRMAIGAQRKSVLVGVLRQGVLLALFGLAIGLCCSLVTDRFLAPLLFGFESFSLLVYAMLVLLMIAVTLVASSLPAHRAASVDPVVALRYE